MRRWLLAGMAAAACTPTGPALPRQAPSESSFDRDAAWANLTAHAVLPSCDALPERPAEPRGEVGSALGKPRACGDPGIDLTLVVRPDGFVLFHQAPERRTDLVTSPASVEVTRAAQQLKSLFPHASRVTVRAEGDVDAATLARGIAAMRGPECRLPSDGASEIDFEHCWFWVTRIEATARARDELPRFLRVHGLTSWDVQWALHGADEPATSARG